MVWSEILLQVLLYIYLLTVIVIAYSVVMENRNPIRTLAWLVVLVALPLVGPIIYMYFGVNYRKAKILSLKGLGDKKWMEYMSESNISRLRDSEALNNPYLKNMSRLITLLHNNNKAMLTFNNHIDILNNGDETFPSIYKSILNAKKFIHIEYYIIENGKLWQKLKEILVKKAKDGVEIRFIYDDVGSWGMSKKEIRELRKSGIGIYPFLPVRFHKLANKANYRNHRKIIIIDGEVGFVGGLNFADRYIDGLPKIGIWRDTHIKITGESVRNINVVFLTDWYFVCQELLLDKEQYLIDHDKDIGGVITQVISSGPDSDWASIRQAYFAMINMAKEHVYISSPYFMTGDAMLTAIKTAAMGGVTVRILLPYRSDTILGYWCTRSYIEEMLEAGVEIYLYKKGLNHSKLIMVDSQVASVGTANMDNRSFEQNFEVGVMIYNREVTSKLEKFFIEDISNSEKLSYNYWKFRSKKEKFKESFARLFAPLL